MQVLHGTFQHYAWGTTDAIPELLGQPADGRPVAEYWLGAHPLAPSEVDGERLDAARGSHSVGDRRCQQGCLRRPASPTS